MSERVEEIRRRWVDWICDEHGDGHPMPFPASDWSAHAPGDVATLLTALASAEREREEWQKAAGTETASGLATRLDDLETNVRKARAEVERLKAEHAAQLAALKVTWEAKDAEVERLKGVLEANRLLSVQEVEQRHRADQAEAALARVRGALEEIARMPVFTGEHTTAQDIARAAREGRG